MLRGTAGLPYVLLPSGRCSHLQAAIACYWVPIAHVPLPELQRAGPLICVAKLAVDEEPHSGNRCRAAYNRSHWSRPEFPSEHRPLHVRVAVLGKQGRQSSGDDLAEVIKARLCGCGRPLGVGVDLISGPRTYVGVRVNGGVGLEILRACIPPCPSFLFLP